MSFPLELPNFDIDYPDLDPGIRRAVRVLMARGVETFESREGGEGHAYPEPTVTFHGAPDQVWRALWAALESGLPVGDVRRVWRIQNGEPTGPYGEITFRERLAP